MVKGECMETNDAKELSTHRRKDGLLQVRLDQKTLQELDECAFLLGMNRSATIRKCIEILIENMKS